MPTMNKMEPVTLDFFDTAPLRVQCTMVAKCTPETLFETLRGDTVWTEWAGVIQGVEWTSEKPYAKNATRDVSIVGGMLVSTMFTLLLLPALLRTGGTLAATGNTAPA